MKLICKNGEESMIYLIDNQIYKYTDDYRKEYEILKYLNNIDDSLPIPKVYSEHSDAIAPSGRIFKKLIIMEYIKPLVKESDMNTLLENQYTKNEYALAIIDILDRIHNLGVYHCDFHLANTILTNKGIYLIDFGYALFKTDTDTVFCSDYYDQFDENLKYNGMSIDNYCVLKFLFGEDAIMCNIDKKLWIDVPTLKIKKFINID
jgi:serine/threonine protein kinase